MPVHEERSLKNPATAGAGTERGAQPRRQVLLTGATGFLGQAVLQALLEATDDVYITAVVRPRGSLSGHRRLQRLLRKNVFSAWAQRVGEDVVEQIFTERVEVLEGDLADMPSLDGPHEYSTVIHSASSVSFDLPIDEAFRGNVDGAHNLYQALRASGQSPHVIHVSTAYVGGISRGLRQEGRLMHDIDWRAEYDAAQDARIRVEAESRRPENLRARMRTAHRRDSRRGPQTVATAAEEARLAWIDERLVDFGRTRAQSVGWTDVYTFTKAMAERVAEETWGETGHRLSFVRPSIIESALHHPFPGWIDGYKVADPLIMAYGRGVLQEFPGLADTILDIIPVDYVVNVILALTTQQPARDEDVAYYQVVSGSSQPLPFHEMVSAVRDYFLEHPLIDEAGQPIEVPEWTFPSVELVEQRFRLKELTIRAGQTMVSRLPSSARTRAWSTSLHRTVSGLSTLRTFMDLYRHYTKTEMVFDDANTRSLRTALPADFLGTHDFDVREIDWRDYLQRVHLPAVTALTNAYAPRRSAGHSSSGTDAPLRAAPGALAIFDLDGTLVSTNILRQYLQVVRATKPRLAWPAAMGGLLASVPRYVRAEQRDRSELIRLVNRRYKGFRHQELRELIDGPLGHRIRSSLRPEALDLIARHRAAGHRTVLVTGALDILVQPLADLFDDLVATRMDVSADGVLTGYLATPPLVDEARANWLRKYAALQEADLTASYGYGDSMADAAWLELVGTPTVVSPDLGLYGLAKKRRWRILEW